jgi:hypothetical protein
MLTAELSVAATLILKYNSAISSLPFFPDGAPHGTDEKSKLRFLLRPKSWAVD